MDFGRCAGHVEMEAWFPQIPNNHFPPHKRQSQVVVFELHFSRDWEVGPGRPESTSIRGTPSQLLKIWLRKRTFILLAYFFTKSSRMHTQCTFWTSRFGVLSLEVEQKSIPKQVCRSSSLDRFGDQAQIHLHVKITTSRFSDPQFVWESGCKWDQRTKN